METFIFDEVAFKGPILHFKVKRPISIAGTVLKNCSKNILILEEGMQTLVNSNQEHVSLKGLAFHGIGLDKMEKSSVSEEMRKNFLEHLIIRLLRREFGVHFNGKFLNICR